MGQPGVPEKARLFVGMLSGDAALLGLARERLETEYGRVDAASDVLAFDFTDYYQAEMGRDLKRQFLAFAEPIDMARLPAIKLRTNELERRIADEVHAGLPAGSAGRPTVPRPVNLDPGYLTLGKVVLATTKDHAHRLHLGNGIYGEVTLAYRDHDWRPWPWTYPDYTTEAYLAFFRRLRERHRVSRSS